MENEQLYDYLILGFVEKILDIKASFAQQGFNFDQINKDLMAGKFDALLKQKRENIERYTDVHEGISNGLEVSSNWEKTCGTISEFGIDGHKSFKEDFDE